jgi:hypothetical protein
MQSKLWTLNALAVELGHDRRTLARKLEGLAPDDETAHGGRVTRRWRLRRVVEHLYAAPERGELNPAQERARRDAEQADRLAMQNAVMRRELLPREDVVREVGGYIDACRTRLLNLPGRLAAELDPEAGRRIEPIARRIVAEAVTELRTVRADE